MLQTGFRTNTKAPFYKVFDGDWKICRQLIGGRIQKQNFQSMLFCKAESRPPQENYHIWHIFLSYQAYKMRS